MEGEGASYTYTGQQRNVGSSPNTFTYVLDPGTIYENYEIEIKYGTLTVELDRDNVITIKASDAKKMYDGTPLTSGIAAVIDGALMGGDSLSAVVQGTVTDAGTATNVLVSVRIMNGSEDVTSNYIMGEKLDGTLTVEKRRITLTSGTDSKVYDANPLTHEFVRPSGSGYAPGEGAEYTFTGTQTDVGSSDNTFTYRLLDGTKECNYDITVVYGKLTVLKDSDNTVIIVSGSAERPYDGTPLTSCDYTQTSGSVLPGHVIDVRCEGRIVNVGTVPNSVKVTITADGKDVTSNYNIKTSEGGLTVSPRSVTIKSADMSSTSNGPPL